MDTQHDPEALEAAYAASVDREREAWNVLHAHAPGTPGRARAWDTWSQTIMRTNLAWRKVSASRIGKPVSQGDHQAALEHAPA